MVLRNLHDLPAVQVDGRVPLGKKPMYKSRLSAPIVCVFIVGGLASFGGQEPEKTNGRREVK